MKRVLFVSRDYNARNDGGSAVAKRNLAFLKALGLQVAELTIGVPSLAVRLKKRPAPRELWRPSELAQTIEIPSLTTL